MRENARIPILALPYSEKDKAVKKELMVDYDTGALYVVSAEDKNVIFDITNSVYEKISEMGLTGDNFNITIEGIGEVKLSTIINEINNSKVSMINSELAPKYHNPKFQVDNKSIIISNNKIQMQGYKVAQNGYVPTRTANGIEWLPLEASADPYFYGTYDVTVLDQDEENNVSLYPLLKLKTVLSDTGTCTIKIPDYTESDERKEYMTIWWNLVVGDKLPDSIIFPSNILWQYDEDKEISINTNYMYEFITLDRSATWLCNRKAYKMAPVAANFINTFNKPSIPTKIKWDDK